MVVHSRHSAVEAVALRRTSQGTPATERFDISPSEPLLIWLVRLVWARRLLFAALTVGIFAPLILLILSLPNQYTARTTVMIDPVDRTSFEERPLPLTLLGDRPAIASEMEVLRSQNLLRRTVVSLGLHEEGALASQKDLAGNRGSFLPRWLLSADEKGGAEDGFAREELVAAAMQYISGGLQIRNLNESRVIEVAFTSRDPVFAAEVANRLVGLYIDLQAEYRTSVAERTTNWLNRRLAQLQDRLVELERAAEENRTSSVLAFGADSGLLLQQIREVSSAIVTSGKDAQRAAARLHAVDAAIAEDDARAVLNALNIPALEELLSREAEAERQLRLAVQRYGEKYPELATQRKELEALQRQIQIEARSRRISLAIEATVAAANLSALRVDLMDLQKRLGEVSASEIEQRALDRQVETAQEVITNFLIRFREGEALPTDLTSAWVVSAADVPIRKSKPKRAILASGAAALSGMLALAGLLFLEPYSSGGLRTFEDVRRILNLKCIAVVPALRKRVWPKHHKDGRATKVKLNAPHYRAVGRVASAVLQASRQGGSGELPQPVLFVSADAGAGTTTLCRSVATLLAALKWRVLIVEIDHVDPFVQTKNVEKIAAVMSRSAGEDGREVLQLSDEPSTQGVQVMKIKVPYGALSQPNAIDDVIRDRSNAFDVVMVASLGTEDNAEETTALRSAGVIIVHSYGSRVVPSTLGVLEGILANGGVILGAVLNQCH